jgi:hypothetical protein
VIKRGLILVAVAVLAISVGRGFAATLSVGSHHLWVGSQTLTKATCTLTGTTQSVDTYVDQNKPTNNFASTATMLVQPDSGAEKRALISFDFSKCSPAIPTTGGADTATLSLRITAAPKVSRTLTLWHVTSSWAATSTWNTQPTYGASSTTTFSTGASANTVSVPVTVDADDFIKGTATNYGWIITDEGSAVANDTTTFATSNAGSNKPTLTINYEK